MAWDWLGTGHSVLGRKLGLGVQSFVDTGDSSCQSGTVCGLGADGRTRAFGPPRQVAVFQADRALRVERVSNDLDGPTAARAAGSVMPSR